MCVAWVEARQAGHLDDAERRARRARRDHRGVRLRRAVGGDRDRHRSPASSLSSASSSSSGSASTIRSAPSPCTACPASGARSRPGSSRCRRSPTNLATGTGGLVYTGSFHQLGVQALGLVAVGAFTFSTSFGALFAMHKLWGIRVEQERRDGGLDVHEHGMWGYPEFYIPVPGGYGTESHGHLGSHRPHAPARTASRSGARVTKLPYGAVHLPGSDRRHPGRTEGGGPQHLLLAAAAPSGFPFDSFERDAPRADDDGHADLAPGEPRRARAASRSSNAR